jgi:uncharacterized repeat protein (TIGR04138 family)
MNDEQLALLHICRTDARYPVEAYLFVRSALAYASDVMQLGREAAPPVELELKKRRPAKTERHLTGQELCEAIRQYALNQFGYLAKTVLENWNIRSTDDFGNIVYNMIGAGLMKRSANDRRADFTDVYDFDEVFERQFAIASCASLRS